MAQANLDKLAKALEQVEARLSKIEGLLGGASSSGAGAGSGGASVDAFDALVAAHIPKFVADSKSIATDVGELVRGTLHFGVIAVASFDPTHHYITLFTHIYYSIAVFH